MALQNGTHEWIIEDCVLGITALDAGFKEKTEEVRARVKGYFENVLAGLPQPHSVRGFMDVRGDGRADAEAEILRETSRELALMAWWERHPEDMHGLTGRIFSLLPAYFMMYLVTLDASLADTVSGNLARMLPGMDEGTSAHTRLPH